MKIKNPKIIRVGDKVKIIKPEIFSRVGYALTKQLVKETLIKSEHKDQIAKLIGQFTKEETGDLSYNNLLIKDGFYKVLDDIEDALAFFILKQNNFGGRERKIYTELKSELLDKIAIVNKKRVVKTGNYVAGGMSYSYCDEPEYTPPYLENEKSHVILVCRLDVDLFQLSDEFEIEACNVEKIQNP